MNLDDYDLGEPVAKGPTRNKKPARNNYDDLFDFGEDDSKLKLPNIASNKPAVESKPTPKKNDEFDLDDLDAPKPPPRRIKPPPAEPKPSPKRDDDYDSEDLEVPKPASRKAKPAPKPKSESEEEVYEESVGGYDPFERKPPSPKKI